MDEERVDMSRAPSPVERAKRSAWATCLQPGDCVQARRALGAASRDLSQWSFSSWLLAYCAVEDQATFARMNVCLRLGRAAPYRSLPPCGKGRGKGRGRGRGRGRG